MSRGAFWKKIWVKRKKMKLQNGYFFEIMQSNKLPQKMPKLILKSKSDGNALFVEYNYGLFSIFLVKVLS